MEVFLRKFIINWKLLYGNSSYCSSPSLVCEMTWRLTHQTPFHYDICFPALFLLVVSLSQNRDGWKEYARDSRSLPRTMTEVQCWESIPWKWIIQSVVLDLLPELKLFWKRDGWCHSLTSWKLWKHHLDNVEVMWTMTPFILNLALVAHEFWSSNHNRITLQNQEMYPIDQPVHLWLDTLHRHSMRYTDRPYGEMLSNNTP